LEAAAEFRLVGFHRVPPLAAGDCCCPLVFQTLLTVLNYCVARALGMNVPLGHFFWIVAIVSIVQMLPVTLAGVGLREGALVYLLKYEGVAASQAFAFSLAIFSVMVILSLTGGLLDLVGYPRVVPAKEPTG